MKLNEDTYEGEINDPLSLNLYTYVSNNPLMHVDPSGNFQALALCFMMCFSAGTKIKTNEGYKAIEDIQVGDIVQTKDEETGEVGYHPVEELFQRVTEEIYQVTVNGTTITTTAEHPFWVTYFVTELEIWTHNCGRGSGGNPMSNYRMSNSGGGSVVYQRPVSVKRLPAGTGINITKKEMDTFFKSTMDKALKSKGTGNTSTLRSQGKPYENHTTVQKTKTFRSLKTTGTPISSVDLYDENSKLIQRRYYDKNGRAKEDIDYEHSNGDNSHVFPHRHTWDWSSGTPVIKHRLFMLGGKRKIA